MSQPKRISKWHVQYSHINKIVKYGIPLLITIWPCVYLFDYLRRLAGNEDINRSPEQITVVAQSLVLFLLCVIVLACRWGRSPLVNKKYASYLAQGPWDQGTSLPFGDCHMTIIDIAAIVGMMSLGFYRIWPALDHDAIALSHNLFGEVPLLWLRVAILASIILIAIPHLLSGWVLCNSNMKQGQLYIALIPCLVFPFYNIYISQIVLILITLVCAWAVHDKIKRFKWELPHYDLDPIKRMRDQACQNNIILRSPFSMGLNQSYEPQTLRIKLIWGGIVAWWLHAIYHVFWGIVQCNTGHSMQQILTESSSTQLRSDSLIYPISYLAMTFICFTLGMANIFRFFMLAPVPIGVRLIRGIWFIPRFDAILLKPVLLFAFGMTMTDLFRHDWMTIYFYIYLSAIGLVLIEYFTPPTEASWIYTWCHKAEVPKPRAEKRNTENTLSKEPSKPNIFGI